MCELDRLADAGIFLDPDRHASGHERSVQRNRNIVFARHIAETVVRVLARKSEKLGQHNGGIGCIAPTRLISPIDDGDLGSTDT